MCDKENSSNYNKKNKMVLAQKLATKSMEEKRNP